MNISESLVGHLLTRNGVKHLIIKAHNSTVIAAYRDKNGTLQRTLVPLAEALQCIDLSELNIADAPKPAESLTPA